MLHKNKCSTYTKYVSASLLLNSLYLHRLFSKGLRKGYNRVPLLKSSAYQKRHGCRWFQAVTRCYANLQPKNGHGRTFLDEDGGGSIQQQRVSQEKNSSQYGLPLELFLTIDKVLLTILPYCCGVLIKHTRKKKPPPCYGAGAACQIYSIYRSIKRKINSFVFYYQ